jgi:hypothetical protein
MWRDFGLQPHRAQTFRLSTDPLFVEKVIDVVGLYHNPPERAVVLCTDEKSQVQALAPGSRTGTPTRNPSSGPRPRTRSSNPSPDIAHGFPAHDTRPVCVDEHAAERLPDRRTHWTARTDNGHHRADPLRCQSLGERVDAGHVRGDGDTADRERHGQRQQKHGGHAECQADRERAIPGRNAEALRQPGVGEAGDGTAEAEYRVQPRAAKGRPPAMSRAALALSGAAGVARPARSPTAAGPATKLTSSAAASYDSAVVSRSGRPLLR